tara:strand:+ start:1472 stop:1672 length:201 start_codon:yes stop_codon:yes gene_type:complete
MTKYQLYWSQALKIIEDYHESVIFIHPAEEIEKHIKTIYPWGIRSGYKWIIWRKVVNYYYKSSIIK